MTKDELDDLIEVMREVANEEAHGAGIPNSVGQTFLGYLIERFKSTWCD